MAYGRIETMEPEILITVLKDFAVKRNRSDVVARGICEVKSIFERRYSSMFVRLIGIDPVEGENWMV